MAGSLAHALIVMAAAAASFSVFAVVGRRILTAVPPAIGGTGEAVRDRSS